MTRTPQAANGGRDVTDVHVHVVPSWYLDHLQTWRGHPAAASALPWLEPFAGYNADALVRDMDAAGIDVCWVSLPPPGAVDDAGESGRGLGPELNRRLTDAAAAYPERLRAVPLLPMSGGRRSEAAAADAIAAGACAMIAHLGAQGPALDNPLFRSALRLLADHGVALHIHPGIEPIHPLFDGWGLNAALSAPVITTVAAARLIVSGTLDELPHLRLIVAHLGGTLPFLLQRLTEQARSDATHDVSTYLRRQFHVDSAAFDPAALGCTAAVLGVDRILLGSDAPFRGGVARGIQSIRAALSTSDSSRVLSENLAALTDTEPTIKGAR
jgi:aminocarboxymuconate-semialdehyde decarboxylase